MIGINLASSTTTTSNPSFPFSIDNEEEYDALTEGLDASCISGDISHLQIIEESFHGVEYEDSYANTALENGHIEFFKRYVMLSRMNLILFFNYQAPLYWRDYLEPLLCALRAHTSDEIRLQAVEFYFDHLLPNLPSRDEVVPRRVVHLNRLIKLPSHRHTIWSIRDFKDFKNPTDRIRCLNSAFIYPYLPILEFLTNRLHLHFGLFHLRISVLRFSRSLYNFVLDHLDPSLDKSKLPLNCRFVHDPSDADFVNILFRVSGQYSYRRTDSDILEFLESFPSFRSKIPSIIAWIRARQAFGPSSDLPSSMRFYHKFNLELPHSTCAQRLEFLEHIVSILGPIDNAEPIQFDSKLLRDRIPAWNDKLTDEERMAAACSEFDQMRLNEVSTVHAQRSSLNDPSNGDDDDDEYEDDDDDDDDNDNDDYDDDNDDDAFSHYDDDNFYDEEQYEDPFLAAQRDYSEEEDSLYTSLL